MSNYDDIFANSQNEDQVENAPQEFNKEDWVAKKQMEREQTYTMMNDMTEKVASEAGAFKQYLDVQSRFDRFSVGNVMLIVDELFATIKSSVILAVYADVTVVTFINSGVMWNPSGPKYAALPLPVLMAIPSLATRTNVPCTGDVMVQVMVVRMLPDFSSSSAVYDAPSLPL